MKRWRQLSYGAACSMTLTVLAMSCSAATAQAPTESPLGDQPATQQNITEAQSDSSQTLKVGTKEILPFVFLEEQVPFGYSVEVWNEIARASGFETEWVRYDSVQSMLDGLSVGEIDAAMAGISITAAREAAGIDFSYPFFRSGL